MAGNRSFSSLLHSKNLSFVCEFYDAWLASFSSDRWGNQDLEQLNGSSIPLLICAYFPFIIWSLRILSYYSPTGPYQVGATHETVFWKLLIKPPPMWSMEFNWAWPRPSGDSHTAPTRRSLSVVTPEKERGSGGLDWACWLQGSWSLAEGCQRRSEKEKLCEAV